MYQLAVLFVLSAPLIGLILIGSFPDEFDWLTSGESAAAPLFYYSIFMIGAAVAAMQFKKCDLKIAAQMAEQSRSEYPLLLVLFAILVVVLVGYGGLDVLTGSMTKEDVRQSGFVHAVLTKYLAPSIFAYFSALRRALRLSLVEWWLACLLTFVVGLSTGGKASALIAILPGVAIMFIGRLSLLRVLLILVFTFGLLMVTAWLFDSFLNADMPLIAQYLVRRTFVLTAEAPFHIGIAYSNNQPTIIYHYTLFEVFGKSVLLNFEAFHEIHKYLFSFAVTAWLYPERIDAITAGIWNITPNVFVEALIVGGAYLLPVIGWVIVYVASVLWSSVVSQINCGRYTCAATISVYAVIVYLSWINSAGIMQLVHPLALGSLALSWICLVMLSRNSSRFEQVHVK